MIDIILRYQGSIFVQASDITPNPDIVTTLIDTFRDKGFIPNTIHEISPFSPAPQARLRLSSPTNEWGITFASLRIDIEKNPIETKGTNMGEVSKFCFDVTDFFERISKRFKKRANRLSLVTVFLLTEMTEPNFSAIYSKLFKPPEFYAKQQPFEWNWRSVSKIPIDLEDIKDTLNVITNIDRTRGGLLTPTGTKEFDRIQISFDINTVQENTEYRFELTHIKAFYDRVVKLHDDLLKEIKEYINE